MEITHSHPTVDNRPDLLSALYRACLRGLKAAK
jgi:hypothetical protein